MMLAHKRISSQLLVIALLAIASLSFGASDMTHQGVAFLKAQRFGEAIKVLSKAIKNDAKDAEAFHYRGIAQYYQGHLEKAMTDYTHAIAIKPDLPGVYTSLGVAQFRVGDYLQAEKNLKTALARNPKDADALNQLAWMLAVCPDKKYRNGKKALDLSRGVINLKTTPNFLDTLAAAYAETGNYDDAVRVQRKVIALLSQEERLNNIEIYLDRLKKYEAHRPWREIRLKSGPGQIKKTVPPAMVKTKKPPIKTPKKTAAVKLVPTPTNTPHKKVPPAAVKARNLSTDGFPYTVFIAAYHDQKLSARKVRGLQKNGDPVFISHAYFKQSGHWYQIYYGWFKNRTAAGRAAQKLLRRKFKKAIVVKKPYAVEAGATTSRSAAKKIAARLSALNYPAYQVPGHQDPGQIRVLIGAYSTRTVPDRLLAVLRKAGFAPRIVRR